MLRKGQSGLSLAEVVITITLLGFIMMVLFNIFPSSLGAVRHAEHQMIASELAQSILETKMEGPYKHLGNIPTLSPLIGPDGTDYTPVYEGAFDVPDTDNEFVKKIRVRVEWQEQRRKYTMIREIYVSSIRH